MNKKILLFILPLILILIGVSGITDLPLTSIGIGYLIGASVVLAINKKQNKK